jgi:hypothetical protein
VCRTKQPNHESRNQTCVTHQLSLQLENKSTLEKGQLYAVFLSIKKREGL